VAQHRCRHCGGVRRVHGRRDSRRGPGQEAVVGDRQRLESGGGDDVARGNRGRRPIVQDHADVSLDADGAHHDDTIDDGAQQLVDDHHVAVVPVIHDTRSIPRDDVAHADEPIDDSGLERDQLGQRGVVERRYVIRVVVRSVGFGGRLRDQRLRCVIGGHPLGRRLSGPQELKRPDGGTC
jgi:hypothetical protein